MAKPNYSFEKRQRELAKKKKKEEKAEEKASRKAGTTGGPATDADGASQTGSTQDGSTPAPSEGSTAP